jgi:hypothetical protein
MWWASQGTAVTPALNPFQPQGGPALYGPYQMAAWPGDFAQRPAVGWNLLRQAVLHVNSPGVDYTPGNYLSLTREMDWRTAIDAEFAMLDSSLGLYTPDAVARQVSAWLTPGNCNWMTLLWSPRVDSAPIGTGPVPNLDPSVMARSRVLLPHAARLRFQVRLSDGTVIPAVDEVSDNPRLRGELVSPVYSLTRDYALPNPQPIPGAAWSFDVADPTPAGTPNSVHPLSQPTYQVPVKQVAYIWTSDNTNVPKVGGTTMLYPVAIRVRVEVYDPERRTPDPVKLDEWLPVRWR